jgi:hypothetical protein
LASLAQNCTEKRTEEIGEGTGSGLGLSSSSGVKGKFGIGPDQRENQSVRWHLAIVPLPASPSSRRFLCQTHLERPTHSCGYPAGIRCHRREILKLQVRTNQKARVHFNLPSLLKYSCNGLDGLDQPESDDAGLRASHVALGLLFRSS